MNHVVVIEALGKVSKIAHLFRQRGETVLIVATNGHLFDIPKDKLNVDLDSLKVTEWVVKCPSRLGSVREALQRADKITVLTDGDVEGEVIAAEIYPLIPEKTKAVRAKLRSLTDEGLSEALFEASPIPDQNLVSQGLSRRITDRVVGYAFQNKSGRLAAIGRVVTPLLASFFESPPISIHIEIDLGGGAKQGPWRATIPFTADEYDIAASLAREVSTLPVPQISSLGVTSSPLILQPYNFGDALSALSERFGQSIQRTQEALQSLYMEGRLTYTRTQSRHISKQSATRVSHLASGQGEYFFNPSRLTESGGAACGPHEALAPTSDVWLGRQLCDIPFEEQCLVAITRRLIEVGQGGKLHVERGQIQPNISSDKWARIQNRLRLPMQIRREWRTQPPFATLDRWDADRALDHRGKPSLKFGHVSLYVTPPENMILDRMRELRLGQPSTMAKFPQTIAKRFFDANGCLNGRSLQALSFARQNIPELLRIESVRMMEECFEDNALPASDRVRAALGKLNVRFDADDKSHLPGMEI